MRIAFSKMHGLGNDFVVIDDRQERLRPGPELLRHLADRRRGIGCDQVLIARAARAPAVARMQVYNADGSPAEQCGNGLRCFAAFLRRRGLVHGESVDIEVAGGLTSAQFVGDAMVRVGMGVPRFEPQAIPLRVARRLPSYRLEAGGETYTVAAVSMGNPHAVLEVEDVAAAPVAEVGARIQASGWFPSGVNVGFLERVSPERLRLRVFERGVGETPACGSGAAAAVACARELGWVERSVAVDLPGGRLLVDYPGGAAELTMTGPATHVFDGEIDS